MEEINSEEFGKYTSWPERKSFAEEKVMVIAAANGTEKGMEVLRKYLKPLVLHWIDDFNSKHPEIYHSEEKLLEAGFSHLDLAVRKYNEHLKEGEVGFKFSTYFEWFIRQGLLESLNKKI